MKGMSFLVPRHANHSHSNPTPTQSMLTIVEQTSFTALFSATPSIDHLYKGEGTLGSHFTRLFKCFTRKSRLEVVLPDLVRDCVSSYEDMDISAPLDPFDALYRLVYQLMLRTLGSKDVADNPKLLNETMQIFTTLDDSSALEVMFPKIPFPSKLNKMWAGTKLHWIFSKIMQDRRTTGRVEHDAMQSLMDAGEGDIIISAVRSLRKNHPPLSAPKVLFRCSHATSRTT